MLPLMCYHLSRQQESLIDSLMAKERRDDWDNTWGAEQHPAMWVMARLSYHHEGREMGKGQHRDGAEAEMTRSASSPAVPTTSHMPIQSLSVRPLACATLFEVCITTPTLNWFSSTLWPACLMSS